MDNSIIVIDDEQDFLDSVKRGLITSGINNVRVEENPRKVASIFTDGADFDIALIDITMPEMDGVELLELIKATSPSTECIMVTAVDEARTAVNCLKKGAYDYLVKPISKEDLVASVIRALERKRLVDILDLSKSKVVPKLKHQEAFKPIVTRSANVLRVLKEAGIVTSEVSGRENWYSLADGALEGAEDWISEVHTMWADALGSLKRFVEEAQDGSSE